MVYYTSLVCMQMSTYGPSRIKYFNVSMCRSYLHCHSFGSGTRVLLAVAQMSIAVHCYVNILLFP